MTIVTHDNKEYRPVLFGKIDSPEPSDIITCVLDQDPFELDMFGNIVHHKIHVSDIKCFKGTLMMTPINLPKSHIEANSQITD